MRVITILCLLFILSACDAPKAEHPWYKMMRHEPIRTEYSWIVLQRLPQSCDLLITLQGHVFTTTIKECDLSKEVKQ